MTAILFTVAVLAFVFAALLAMAGMADPTPSLNPVYKLIIPAGVVCAVSLLAGVFSLIF